MNAWRIPSLLVLALLVASLSGCADMANGWQRAALGIDCRPEKLQNGMCVSTAKKEAK
jgi:hypothetical protein